MTMTTEEHKAAAAEILNQLGGGRFMVMCGVQYPAFESHVDAPNLSFKFRGSPRANHCKIVLNSLDTYTVTFLKVRGTEVKTVKVWEGVYNDMLQDIFTTTTGLHTTLGTMGR